MSRVNLNVASEDELTTLDGVDRALALTIVETRRTKAGFRSWDDVRAVPGLDELLFQRLQKAACLAEERGDEREQDGVNGDVSGEGAVRRAMTEGARRWS